MRKTFFTDGRDLFDPSGKKVILRGVNKMSVWDENDPTGDSYFAEIRRTQANSVRIVWAITKDLKPGGAQTDLDTLDALITNARMIPLDLTLSDRSLEHTTVSVIGKIGDLQCHKH